MFTETEASAAGLTRAALRWGEKRGRWRRVDRAVYAEGGEVPSEFDQARARVLSVGAVASGALAGVLHGLDGVEFDGRPIRRRMLPPEQILELYGTRCTDGFRTLVDLAAHLDDDVWEQALESALRRRLTTVHELEDALPELGRARTRGVTRMRRVLARRRPGARPTESLLETLMVQLARGIDGLPEPERQYDVFDPGGLFVARLDLGWPTIGLFIELDGQQHLGQPVYDARRETAIVAATGWLVGRFTWREVVSLPHTTARRLAALADQAGRRGVSGSTVL